MRVTLALFLLASCSHALPLKQRQLPPTPSAPSPSDSNSASTSLALVLGLTGAFLGLLLIGTGMFLGRRRVREFFRKHFGTDQVNGQEPPSPSPPSSPTPPARRPPLTHAPSSTNTARPGTPRSHHPPSGVTVADRPVGNPRPERSGRRRRRRRTQSPVGLPLYSQEPGEEEMSLFKSQDMFESQLDLSLSLSRATTVERSYEDGEGYESEQEEEEDEIFERGGETRGRPSMEGAARLGGVSQSSSVQGHGQDSSGAARLGGVSQSSSVQGHGQDSSGAGLLQPPSVLSQGRPRSASEPLGPPRLYTTSPNTRVSLSPYMSHTPSSGSSSPFASRSGLIDIPLRPPSPPQTPPLPSPLATRSPGRPTYFTTHRSSRSSPINTLTPPSPASSIRNAGRPRASTLQRLLSGGVNGSTSSLASGGSPYAEGAMGRTASASTVSIRTQEISAPLPGSFVHSSFIFPRSGPTPQQVAFISSRESLGAYGYGNGVAPPHHPLSPTLPEAPPAFGLDEGGRRSGGLEPGTGEGGVRGRGRSGSEASRISGRSPLAVEVREGEGQSPPRSPREVGQLDERASGARGEAVTAGAAHVPPELVSPPSPKPPSSASPAVDLSSTRSSRPHPPDIVTLAPTPTASAAPSPLLPPLSSASATEQFFDYPPEVALREAAAYHSLAYSFDFRANIVSGEPTASFAVDLGGPWGKWTCEYAHTSTDLTLSLRPAVDMGPTKKVRYRLKLSMMRSEYDGMRYIHQTDYKQGWDASTEEGKMTIRVKNDHWEEAADASEGRYDPDSRVRYRLSLDLEIGDAPRPRDIAQATGIEPLVLLDRLPTLEVSGASPDVRLFFPDAVEGGAELWTHSEFLSFCSPYMKTLLSSDFAEAVSVPAKRRKSEGKAALAGSGSTLPSTTDNGHDSDAETDDTYFAQKPHELKHVDREYKEIKITKAAFSTYRAVLAYLRTGHIAFAPLTSKCTAVQDDTQPIPPRQTQIETAAAENPDRPYLVSPKSVYRLAHLLELQNLQSACLTILREGGLTVSSAPAELFDETCVLHEAWRRLVVEYITQNWEHVKKTSAWKELERKLEADEIPGAMLIMMQLFKAREKFSKTSSYY